MAINNPYNFAELRLLILLITIDYIKASEVPSLCYIVMILEIGYQKWDLRKNMVCDITDLASDSDT